MFHQTIRALSEAGLLLAAGAFARNLGFLESTDAQVCAILPFNFGCLSSSLRNTPQSCDLLVRDLKVVCFVQVGLKAAAYVTLPALALQILSVPGVAGPQALIVLAASAVFSAAVALLGWCACVLNTQASD